MSGKRSVGMLPGGLAQQDAGCETRCWLKSPESSQDWGPCWEKEYLWAVGWLSSKFLKWLWLIKILLKKFFLKIRLKRKHCCFKYDTYWNTKIYVVSCLRPNLKVALLSFCGEGEGSQYNQRWYLYIVFGTTYQYKVLTTCSRFE